MGLDGLPQARLDGILVAMQSTDLMAPFVPTKDVVEAAAASAEEYLNFLCDNKAGVEKHRAVSISSTENCLSLLENTVWQIYHCNLPQHQRIRSDSSATFIPDVAPGKQMEIRILEYDRKTGQTTFAAQGNIDYQTGTVVVDFRWLVKRCLEWLQRNGNRIPGIRENGATQPDAMAPFEVSVDDGLTGEQSKAIRTMLTARLSYIWGPPGTGKTKWVLAKAVRHCTDQNRKIIVLASTNAAVDNALTAVLEAGGVDPKNVARIGIPAPSFVQRYPDCCEERALQHEIRQIEAQTRTLKENIASVHRARNIQEQINENQADLDKMDQRQNESNVDLDSVMTDLSTAQTEATQRIEELKSLEKDLGCSRQHLADLGFAKVLSDIEILESEQTKTITIIQQQMEELRNLGVIARLFTGRKQEISVSILRNNQHLRSVEATLERKRKKRDELAPSVSKLTAQVAQLETSCDRVRGEITQFYDRISTLKEKQRYLLNRIRKIQESKRSLEANIQRANQELSRIRENLPPGLADKLLATWQKEIEDLEARRDQFKQDLSRKLVLGMTLDGFIGLTMQMSLSVAQVFIDEAPYAPLAKVLPLLSLHCPIAMLGDHRQLPPVCECQNDATIRAYWAKPSIFLEDAFRFGRDRQGLHALKEPRFHSTQLSKLTKSYRFGQLLASLLDRHIYQEMGFEGLGRTFFIDCIDCEPRNKPGRNRRENDAEANAIVEKIGDLWKQAKAQRDPPTIAILTPYKNQAKLIRKHIRSLDSALRDDVEVFNTHQAQGREWDWVLFSVSDTGNLEMNDPYFTDSNIPDGKAVLNTTISRAKERLVIFMDSAYWQQRTPVSLLTEVARSHGKMEQGW